MSMPDGTATNSDRAWRAELRAFIVGTGQFENKRGDPQVDYNRWNQLRDYYHRLADESTEKRMIRQTIVDLIDDPAPEAKDASASLSRVLEFQELSERIVALAQRAEFCELPQIVREEILHAAAHFEVAQLSGCIVESMVSWNKLGTYFRWDTVPWRDTVSQNDHWRIEALSRYYLEQASQQMRSSIAEQLRELVGTYPGIRRTLQAYADQRDDRSDEFLELLRNELAATDRAPGDG